MRTLLVVSGWVWVLVTFLATLRTPLWWVRACDFPRLQIAAFLLLTLVGLLVVPGGGGPASWLFLALLAGCLLYQLHRIRPYVPRLARRQSLAAESADPGRRVSLLVANVLMSNREFGRLRALVERVSPDLVLLLETDGGWEEALRGLEEAWPHTVKDPRDNTYGLLLYSRLELRDVELRYLVEDDVPSVRCKVVLPGGAEVTFYGLHPRPPLVSEDSAPRDAELVLAGREARRAEGAVIIAGDMNDVAWSHTTRLFQRVSGLLDPRVGRGMYNTFHANIPVLRYPLDHVFHSAELRLVRLERLPAFGSDHFPICAELSYEPEAEEEQPEPQPEGDDVEEERRILEEVDETAEVRKELAAVEKELKEAHG